MVKRMRLVGAIAMLGLTAFIGCSSDDDDEAFVPNTTQGSGTNASGSGTASGSGSGTGGGSSSSSNTGSSSGNGNVTGSSTTGATGSTGAAGATGTSGGGPGGPACSGFPIEETQEEVCVGTGYEAERADVDMYIMVDHTSSMDNSDEVTGNGLTRWDLTVEAINDFVNSPGAANIRVALQFFAWETESDCNVNNYNTPLVDMDFAPEVADEIATRLDEQFPIGFTPTYPALQGAIEFAKDWQQGDGRGRQTVVVFVTDGYPTECDPKDPSAVAQLAADSFLEEPRVPVYVIGLDGVLNLDQIAQAGGTRDAYDITSGGSTDEFVQALANITNSEVTCEFQIPEPPDGQVIDYEEVQVVYEPASGDTVEVPFSATGYSGCNDSDQGGWYFGGSDGNGNYTKILTCPCTCAAFQAGVVEVRLGCSPRPVIN